MNNEINYSGVAHYNRVMNEKLEQIVLSKFSWLIQFVKEHQELDFQTGQNKGRSWFSIYRGTGRVLSLEIGAGERSKLKIHAAEAYCKLASPDCFNEETLALENFSKYIDAVNASEKFERYYNVKAPRNEGYYQNLISRRYTLNTKPEDEFVIVDKELVIGFDSATDEENWNSEIVQKQEKLIEQVRNAEKGKRRFPKYVSAQYGEFDFLAIDKEGNFIIMELKQNDGQKTSLSPIQANYYKLQFEKLLAKDKKSVCNALKNMIEQKIRMGLIVLPSGFNIPNDFKGGIKACVIVGDETGISETLIQRYKTVKDIVMNTFEAYKCTSAEDGTIVPCFL